MSRPSVLPDWASNSTYGAGARPWNGQPNKTQPSAGVLAEGFDPENPLYADFVNWVLNNHGAWIDYIDSRSSFREEWFGQVASLAASQTTPIAGAEKWIYLSSTTTQFSTNHASSTYPHPVALLTTSASLNSTGTVYTGRKLFNPSTSTLMALFRTTVSVDAAGDSYIGFCDGNDYTSGASRFIRFRQSHGTANWQAECSVSGTTTTVDTGVAVATSTDPNTSLAIEIHGSAITGGAKVIFTVNGTSVTITSNIPALASYIAIQNKNTNTAATTTTIGPVLVVW